MPNDVTVPPWMLWTAAALCASAVVGLVAGSWRNRRLVQAFEPVLTFQALPSGVNLTPPAPGSSQNAKSPAFMPAPAPLAPALPDGQSELRADHRRVGNPVLVLVADGDTHHRPWNAWVIDRSRRGVRLAVDRKLPVGHVYTIRPTQAPPATPWSGIEVRHCAEVDGHWEIGCRFLQAPPVPLLMLFG